MKTQTIRTVAAGFLIALAAVALLSTVACGGKPTSETRYTCPMHPAVVSDKPGDCPICGMRLVPIAPADASSSAGTSTGPGSTEASRPPATAGSTKKAKTMYRSTMNPGEVSDKPGKDSMGMDLVPFEPSDGPKSDVAGLAPIRIDPERQKLLRLATAVVERRRLEKEIRAAARIVPDETRLYRVTTKFEGWVEQLDVNTTGQAVRKGQPLLSVFSPALLASQEELVSAIAAAKALGVSRQESVVRGGIELVEAAKRRLRLWDVDEAQIERIARTGKTERLIRLFAPASGSVLEKSVLNGQKVMPGDPLLVIADLSRVWAEAAIYEPDLGQVRIGMRASLSLPSFSGRTFEGRIVFLNPFLDPASRTVKARLEVPNADGLLRPDMFGDMKITLALGERTTIPLAAVMRTGRSAHVFRAGENGTFVPVKVELGVSNDDDVEVLSGLAPGDRIVASGNFLVDSESSLRAALEAAIGDAPRGESHP